MKKLLSKMACAIVLIALNLCTISTLIANPDVVKDSRDKSTDGPEFMPLGHVVHQIDQCPEIPKRAHPTCRTKKMSELFRCSYSECGIMDITLPSQNN